MQNPSQICPHCQSPIPADAPGGLCPACVLLGVAGPTNPSQAIAANAPTIEEVAAAFPELEILELIGQGGMGVVFKARQPRLDRLVALKILPPALAAQPGFAERFTREARVLARLAHPHIVAIYDFGESAGFFYLIMELVNGVNLRAAMRAGVKPEQALLLVPHICEALQFAHDHGVLHRDIKPENILLDVAGVPKLADFGIAKLAGEESLKTGLTATGAALGTAAYMAPEQVEKPATVDHRADIYSLGVVLYEMLTGELPLGRFAAPSEKSHVNRGVDEVVMRALEKERERRQQSAGEMKTQVEGAATNATAGPVRNSFETISAQRICGLPLYHIVRGPDPRTGLASVARGVIALGPVAKGIIAVGGRAHGLIACGGVAVGGIAIGGLTIGGACLGGGGFGIASFAGVAFGLAYAFGGFAVGANAFGGAAIGLKAAGGLAIPLAGLGSFTQPLLWLIANALLMAVAWTILPDLIAAARMPSGKPPTLPRNPWPQRIFFLILAIVLLPTMLIGFGLLMPLVAVRQAARATREENAARMAALQAEVQAATRRDVIAIQDEAIRLAREHLTIVKAQFEAGTTSLLDRAVAERDVALAEARGDALRIAKVNVSFAQTLMAFHRGRQKAGVESAAAIAEAESAVNAARLEQARIEAQREQQKLGIKDEELERAAPRQNAP